MTIKFYTESELYDPIASTDGAVAYDLKSSDSVIIPAGSSCMVGTGVFIEIPKGIFGDLRPRSSVWKKTLLLTNCAGVIDNDYRGEIKAVFYNYGNNPVTIDVGERIVQLIFTKCIPPSDINLEGVMCLDELSETKRGDGGYGSTGRM